MTTLKPSRTCDILLLSCPGKFGEGRALDTSRATTPVSSLTAVDDGVVAVTWIPFGKETKASLRFILYSDYKKGE